MSQSLSLNDFSTALNGLKDNQSFYVNKNGQIRSQCKFFTHFTSKSTLQNSTRLFLLAYQNEHDDYMALYAKHYLESDPNGKTLSVATVKKLLSLTKEMTASSQASLNTPLNNLTLKDLPQDSAFNDLAFSARDNAQRLTTAKQLFTAQELIKQTHQTAFNLNINDVSMISQLNPIPQIIQDKKCDQTFKSDLMARSKDEKWSYNQSAAPTTIILRETASSENPSPTLNEENTPFPPPILFTYSSNSIEALTTELTKKTTEPQLTAIKAALTDKGLAPLKTILSATTLPQINDVVFPFNITINFPNKTDAPLTNTDVVVTLTLKKELSLTYGQAHLSYTIHKDGQSEISSLSVKSPVFVNSSLMDDFLKGKSPFLTQKAEAYLNQLRIQNDLPIREEYIPLVTKLLLEKIKTTQGVTAQRTVNPPCHTPLDTPNAIAFLTDYQQEALTYLKIMNNDTLRIAITDMNSTQKEAYLSLLSIFEYVTHPYLLATLKDEIQQIKTLSPNSSIPQFDAQALRKKVFESDDYLNKLTPETQENINALLWKKSFDLTAEHCKRNGEYSSSIHSFETSNMNYLMEMGFSFEEAIAYCDTHEPPNKEMTIAIFNRMNLKTFLTQKNYAANKSYFESTKATLLETKFHLKRFTTPNLSYLTKQLLTTEPVSEITIDLPEIQCHIEKNGTTRTNTTWQINQTSSTSTTETPHATPLTPNKNLSTEDLTNILYRQLETACTSDAHLNHEQLTNTLLTLSNQALLPLENCLRVAKTRTEILNIIAKSRASLSIHALPIAINITAPNTHEIRIEYKNTSQSPIQFNCCYTINTRLHNIFIRDFSLIQPTEKTATQS